MKKDKPKTSRKERERQMIAEMESAMLAQKFPETGGKNAAQTPQADESPNRKKKAKGKAQENKAQQIHCPRCKTVMKNGKCPTCGHYIYVPMDEKKRKKIRLIVGGVCLVAFAVLFVVLQLKK